jgi:ABC-type lipoprotein export system ATPase subunit
MNSPILELKGVCKDLGDPPQRILNDISFSLQAGEFVSLTGRSGSGKSTLLYVLSTLDSLTAGQIFYEGRDITKFSDHELHRLRNRSIGFVFQFHYLLPELSALENVLMPSRKCGLYESKIATAYEILDRVGLKGKEHSLPRQLSGGQCQRVAIARSLVMNPRFLFADEPTGSLDSVNGDAVMNLFREFNKTLGTTIVMVTHDPEFSRRSSRRIELVDGRVVNDEKLNQS